MEACTEYSKKLLRTFRSTRRQLPSPEEEGFTNSDRFRSEPVSNMRARSRPLRSGVRVDHVSELPSSRPSLPRWSSPDPRGVPPRARFKLSSKQYYSWASVTASAAAGRGHTLLTQTLPPRNHLYLTHSRKYTHAHTSTPHSDATSMGHWESHTLACRSKHKMGRQFGTIWQCANGWAAKIPRQVELCQGWTPISFLPSSFSRSILSFLSCGGVLEQGV